jgi:hypothetical protein
LEWCPQGIGSRNFSLIIYVVFSLAFCACWVVAEALVLVGIWLAGYQLSGIVKRRDSGGNWIGSSRISSSTYAINDVLGFSLR